ncbi:tetrahydromethanopterin S-methyltransferase subunit G [Bacillus ectoiniformans]|uniref:spore germination protein n=1 Tax=Bacillus ectoiniformans TaxID=1494429 RepID=UPI00195D6AC2|nr:spore germination protein [Bacillus ectoiniformans]MBM7647405.1 tetrahydromethanopterin S-methyltransferase subunit G [Bacillus ectoiniformans]
MRKKFPIKKRESLRPELSQLLEKCKQSKDFLTYKYDPKQMVTISYFKTLVDADMLHQEILSNVQEKEVSSLAEISCAVPIENPILTTDLNEVQEKLLTGFVLFHLENDLDSYLLLPAPLEEKRQISIPETEYSVVGPKEGFVESLDTNLNLIRSRLPILDLTIKELHVGKLTKTRVAVIYIKGVADEDNIQTVMQRIQAIEYDQVIDSSFINQLITDNPHSPFPQLIDTERPDRVAGSLVEGKIIILADGSPHALTGPTTFIEFFSATEDYFITWHIASAFRLIRIFAVIFSVLATPAYVAILTYHYEMIPQDLLNTLVSSRSGIPFPPILEAVILEITIELLREAGARLPTKIGQTIGIVGGIVIGTAAVEAGLTSNVLLIIVALSALASFTTPIYQMSNTIRLIRFPFLIMAQLLGLVGLAVCFACMLGHLLKLTSLGRPYLEPLYPFRFKDLKDAFIRLPLETQTTRPLQMRSNQPVRFESKPKKPKMQDIDE